MSHFNDTTQLTVKKRRSNTLRTTLVKKTPTRQVQQLICTSQFMPPVVKQK